MTRAAFHGGDPLNPAVKAGARRDVAADLVVAGGTQDALFLLAERRMALAAIVLETGMAFGQGTRHDQRLDSARPRRRPDTECKYKKG
jgi:hypothetical protein